MNFKLSEEEWFAFISGMLVGEWFNSSTSNMEYQTIFEPIGIGGTPTTGLKIDKIPYTGQEEATFSLTTHHVNIKYCGFNVVLNVPSGLKFLGFAYGDFSENIEVIEEEDSKLYIQGFKENNEHIEKESLLCLLKFQIVGTPTKNQPLTFQNGNYQSFESSMLLQYMQGIYWGISPMKNEDGGLIVEDTASIGLSGPTISVPIGEESLTQYLETETNFYTESGFVCFQNKGDSYDNYTQNIEEVGIIANNSYSRNFWLNLGESAYGECEISHVEFNFYLYSELLSYNILHDPLTNAPYKYYTETLKAPEWNSCTPSLRYEYTEEELEGFSVPFRLVYGDYAFLSEPVSIRHISMTAYNIKQAGTYSLGCFNLSYSQHKYILGSEPRASYIEKALDLIYGVATVYYANGESEEVLLSSKYTAVSKNVYGVFENEESSAVVETIEKNESLGYTELEGEVYSDSEQDIEFVIGDLIYRVHLSPGWNKIKIKIPNISYKKQVIIVKIKVVVPEGGYVLFPLGFTIKKKSSSEILEVLPFMSSMVEKVFVRDKFSYNKFTKEEVDLDALFENIKIIEVFNSHRVEIEKLLLELIENIKIIESSEVGSGGVSVNLDSLFEALSINEKFFNSSISTTTSKEESSEGVGISDYVVFE